MTSYADLVNVNGEIQNTKTGVRYSSPDMLAKDLGVPAGSIQWGNIKTGPAVQAPAPAAPAQSFGFMDGSSYNVNGVQQQAPQQQQQQPGAPQPAVVSTGNADLDGALAELRKFKDNQNAMGKVINPNTEISPATVQQFLDMAESEISPYYQNQYKAIKSDISRSLSDLQKSYDLNKQQSEAQFKQDLSSKRSQLAGNGLAYSGFRGQQENSLADSANIANEKAANAATSAAKDAISATEQRIGSSNLPGNYGSLSAYSANTAGQGGFSSGRTLDFSPLGGVTGSLQYAEKGDVRSLQDFLTNSEVKKRTLNFTG